MTIMIRDLRPGMEHVDVKGSVLSLKEPRNITTYYKLEHVLVEGEIDDGSGKAAMSVWDDAISQLKDVSEGDLVELLNCFITSFKKVIHVNVGRDSSIVKISKTG